MKAALLMRAALLATLCSSMARAEYYATTPFVIAELRSDWLPYEGMVVIPPAGVTILNRAGCPARAADDPGNAGKSDGAGLTATSNPAYKTLSAMLIAAFLSGKQVRLYFNQPYGCAVGRPALSGVDIINN